MIPCNALCTTAREVTIDLGTLRSDSELPYLTLSWHLLPTQLVLSLISHQCAQSPADITCRSFEEHWAADGGRQGWPARGGKA